MPKIENDPLPYWAVYRASIPLGVMVAGRVFNPGQTGIWVDCHECGRRDLITDHEHGCSGKLSAMTTEKAEAIFRSRGWFIQQDSEEKWDVYCPEHGPVRP